MMELRQLRDKDARDKLYIQYEDKVSGASFKTIFDSSHIIGARTIQKHLRRQQMRRAQKAQKKLSINASQENLR